MICQKTWLLWETRETHYMLVEDGTYYGITPGGQAASPILCPEHFSKTILAMVMKLHGWIDLIKAECSTQDHNSCLLKF